MLQTKLTDILNGGEAWALVGSGVSIDSGYPTWKELVSEIFKRLNDELRHRLEISPPFIRASNQGNYIKCLDLIESVAGRSTLIGALNSTFSQKRQPGKLCKEIASWPFAGYATLNYDRNLEDALRGIGEMGWTSVGNTEEEVRKVSGGRNKLIWHVHGIAENDQKSRPIVTTKDYDSIYVDGGYVNQQLAAILSQRRVVILGFGFKDPEVSRLLRIVGRMTDPTQPIYAFLADAGDELERLELLRQYNVEVIPYTLPPDGKHTSLLPLASAYGSLTVRRNARFTNAAKSLNAHEETIGLLIYNQLCVDNKSRLSSEVLESLLRARILSRLYCSGTLPISEIYDDLQTRTHELRGTRDMETVHTEVQSALSSLAKEELIDYTEPGGTLHAKLTLAGKEKFKQTSADALILEEQFDQSVLDRCLNAVDDGESANRMATVAQSFIKTAISKKALAVALASGVQGNEAQDFQVTAILQDLPEKLQELSTRDEAVSLVTVIEDLLKHQNEIESRYIGLLLQAQFGVHVLGLDQATLRARIAEITDTLFICDSSSLIPLVAKGSASNPAAKMLVDRLKQLGCEVVTTKLLENELAGHLQWASRITSKSGSLSNDVYLSVSGHAGVRPNAFLEGFVAEITDGQIMPEFENYLISSCSLPVKDYYQEGDFDERLSKDHISVISFNEVPGFTDECYHIRDDYQACLRLERQFNGSYRNERQVQAEAEAGILVQNFRSGKFTFGNHKNKNAFFISRTRVIDRVVKPRARVTVQPEAVLQWAATIFPTAPEELIVLSQMLFGEISRSNLNVIDESKLRFAFAPVFHAAKEQLEAEIIRHRAYITDYYSEASIKRLEETDLLDAPMVASSYFTQLGSEFEKKIIEERRIYAESVREREQAKITVRERGDYERLKSKRREKAEKHRRQRLRKDS